MDCCIRQPGDIVRVKNGEMIPADLVVLQTGLPEGVCYINTANLDGETNLKLRKATSQTLRVPIEQVRGLLECDPPNAHLYEFTGKLTIAPGLLRRMWRFDDCFAFLYLLLYLVLPEHFAACVIVPLICCAVVGCLWVIAIVL